MAFTTLNPGDKDTHITLSGGNLTAVGTAGWTGLVRAIDAKSTGKFYWETTFNATQTNSGVGLAVGSLNVATQTFANAGTGKCGVTQQGTVWVDGAATFTLGGVAGSGVSFGTIASGTIICVAVDLTAKLIWWRLGAAGNWNNNASRDPATGVGGASIPNVGTTYPTDCFGGADTLISNFGSTALVGAVPSGFTPGWGDQPVLTGTYTKYNDFTEQLHRGKHDFGTHTFKLALSNTTPNVATHRSLSDIGEIAAGNGYPAGGVATAISLSRSGGTTTISATDTTITATSGSIASFRYVALYNDSMTSPADGLIAYLDCGAVQTIAAGQSFIIDFNPIVFTHT